MLKIITMFRLVTASERRSNIHAKFRMPQLPDPANTENQFVHNERLDFNISLGSALARSDEHEGGKTEPLPAPSYLSHSRASKSTAEFGRRKSLNKIKIGKHNSRRGSLAVRSLMSNVEKETVSFFVVVEGETVSVILLREKL